MVEFELTNVPSGPHSSNWPAAFLCLAVESSPTPHEAANRAMTSNLTAVLKKPANAQRFVLINLHISKSVHSRPPKNDRS